MFRSKKKEEKPEEKAGDPANDKLVQIAVKFLQNPKVEGTSEETKKAFLKKKGLNDENIKKAFQLYAEAKKKPIETPTTQTNVVKSDETTVIPQNNMKVESIEEKIEAAKKTNFLSLKNCNVLTLNPTIFSLDQLQTLIISFNKITIIPNEIKNLSKLRIFHGVSCFLRDDQIQPGLWELTNLVELNLAKNNLVSIEPVMNLKSLSRLDVSENQIMEIPEKINNLTGLEIFNFRNNNISEIPLSIKDLKNLKRIIVSENNLNKKLEEEIKTKGIPGMIKYLEELY